MPRHPYDRLGVIVTPREGMGSCQTHDQYVAKHVAQLRDRAVQFPALGFAAAPRQAPDGQVAFIHGGKWIVECPCGEIPIASPDWDEARCFQCGAIYRHLTWPAARAAIEAALLARPSAVTRSWLPHETVADLARQNAEHGIGASAAGGD